MIHKSISMFVIALLMLSACKNDSETEYLMPGSTGMQGQIMVIMSSKKWESASGDTLRSVLQEEILGLPQPESNFKLVQLPHEGFSKIDRRYRNLFIVSVSESQEKTALKVSYNKWAKPQIVIHATAHSEEELIELLHKHRESLPEYFIKAERERLIKTYSGMADQKIRKAIREKYKIDLAVPQGFKLDVDSPHFAWISRETPTLTQAILIWDYPYKSKKDLNLNQLVFMRDSMTINNVPGPTKGSFMTSEKRMPIHYDEIEVNDRYTAELRGLWMTEGAFMGGPFVSHTTVDTFRNRLITVDGFVYAGKQNKRNFMRQVEAILHTLEIIPPDDE